MEWWREARLGMFLHWGLYSIPAGQWKGHTGYGEWIREEAHIPVGDYEKFRSEFNPVKFNADSFVKMAHDAGMKYIVITTKHHDGFGLFDSKFTDWCIRETPFHRDVMAEVAAACKKYGLRMCWYHSIMDWHHPDYLPRRSWEVAQRPVDGANMDRYVEYLRNQVTELLTKYGPIGVMWFDGEWEATWDDHYGKPLYELCRKLQPNVIVNNRVSNNRGGSVESSGEDQRVGDFSTPEQFIPPTGLGNVDWETCMTMNDHWGYNSHDTNWKSSKELIRNIVDVASKGGNYLLNIGPRSDGTFPPEAVDRLKAIGAWMKTNGQAIFGTTASVFDNLPWGRCTTRSGNQITTLYLQVFDWPKDGKLVVPGIGNEPMSARLMIARRDTQVARVGSDLVIQVGKIAPDANCSVVQLDVRGPALIYKAPKIEAPAEMIVGSTQVSISSSSPELDVRYTLDGVDPTPASPLYKDLITLSDSGELRAAAFHKGKRVSPVSLMKFAKVEPKPAVRVDGLQPGLWCEEFKGNWDVMPDFSKLTPRVSFAAHSPDLTLPSSSESSKEEFWGRRFTGYITVPDDAVYLFDLTSDDGSKLWIDDEVVIDNDGLHGSVTKRGQAALAKGSHKIVLGWFNKSGGLDLALHWAKAGEKMGSIPNSAFGFAR